MLEYIVDIDDKLFKKYSNGKNFSSFINEFDRATNEEGKVKVVKELQNINSLVRYDIDTDEDSKYIRELFDNVNAINIFYINILKKDQD